MKRELTNQELLDRYIHSVKTLLPPDKVEDVAAEIRSNLESLVEDQERQRGRSLSAGEFKEILKQHGHPRVVASRYGDRPGRVLIGPELFPFYWQTLRAIVGAWVVIRVIGAVLAFQGSPNAGPVLLYLSRDILVAGFLIGAGVTAVFAAWEYMELPFPYPERWKPEHLPRVQQQKVEALRPVTKILRGIVELFFFAIALFWPTMFWAWNRAGIFSPSATVSAMRLPFLVLALLWLFQIWLNFTRFAEAEWRPSLRTGVHIAGFLFVLLLLLQGDLLVAGTNMQPAQSSSLATLNHFFAGILTISCLSSGVQCVRGLRRVLRKPGPGSMPLAAERRSV